MKNYHPATRAHPALPAARGKGAYRSIREHGRSRRSLAHRPGDRARRWANPERPASTLNRSRLRRAPDRTRDDLLPRERNCRPFAAGGGGSRSWSRLSGASGNSLAGDATTRHLDSCWMAAHRRTPDRAPVLVWVWPRPGGRSDRFSTGVHRRGSGLGLRRDSAWRGAASGGPFGNAPYRAAARTWRTAGSHRGWLNHQAASTDAASSSSCMSRTCSMNSCGRRTLCSPT